MILSVIDIGTNTILMVTLAAGDDGTIRVLGDEHEIARLGKGVDSARRIMPETFDRVAGYLAGYRVIAEGHGADRIVAFGTSALRDAANREEFMAAMRERTGIAIELLGGGGEAALTYRGALFGLNLPEGRHAVLDIGGGSTEVAYGRAGTLEQSSSIDIGAVRVTERFLESLPADEARLNAARSYAADMLGTLFDLPADADVVGVAGTVTTLGAMERGMASFDADELNGTRLDSEAIMRITDDLCRMPVERIAAIPQVHPARADILPGGAIILDEFMRRFKRTEIIVSTRGVRYGVALRELDRERGGTM